MYELAHVENGTMEPPLRLQYSLIEGLVWVTLACLICASVRLCMTSHGDVQLCGLWGVFAIPGIAVLRCARRRWKYVGMVLWAVAASMLASVVHLHLTHRT